MFYLTSSGKELEWIEYLISSLNSCYNERRERGIMKSEIYFDNSATTKPYPEVVDEVIKIMNEYYNPSSIYDRSIELSKRIEKVRRNLLRSIAAEKGTFIFTSGGTESINWAIRSGVHHQKTIITTSYEHDATIKMVDSLEQDGQKVIKIEPKDYHIRIEDILSRVNEDTSLVSVMHVNNETGHMIDLEKLCAGIKKKNPRTDIHIDAVQSFMKYPIDIEKCAIDFLSISGHKIHGIKGVGALYIRQPEKMKPLIFGGGQEQGLRSGTENTVGIIALGKAVEIAQGNFKKNLLQLELLREHFVKKISEIDAIVVNSPEGGARHIVNVSFLGVPSEIMLHSLEERGVYVSSGSACSAKKKGSRVLETLKLKDVVRNSAIRFSFSHQNTFAEIDQTIDILKNITSDIRMITRYIK